MLIQAHAACHITALLRMLGRRLTLCRAPLDGRRGCWQALLSNPSWGTCSIWAAVAASVAYQAHSFSTSALSCSGSSTHKDLLVCRQDPSSMQAAVDANVAYQARNDPEYQQLVAQQQEMRGPGALGAMQVGQAALCRPLCLHVVPVSE